MTKKTWQQAGICRADADRIQNAADSTKQTIYVVGSRASGTARHDSDWDYILTGNSAQRNSAKNKLPGFMSSNSASELGLGPGVTTTGRGIDLFQNRSDNKFTLGTYQQLDHNKDYVEFVPTVELGKIEDVTMAKGGMAFTLTFDR